MHTTLYNFEIIFNFFSFSGSVEFTIANYYYYFLL